jgi:hypothetical protein
MEYKCIDFGNNVDEYLKYKKMMFDLTTAEIQYRIARAKNKEPVQIALDKHLKSWKNELELHYEIDSNNYCHVTAAYQADTKETTIMFRKKTNTWYVIDLTTAYESLTIAKNKVIEMFKTQWGIQ